MAGAFELSGQIVTDVHKEDILRRICPNPDAKHMHRFVARSYREYVRPEIGQNPILIDEMDASTYRFAMAFRVRSREEGLDIRGADRCKAFLNQLVDRTLADLCGQLKEFNPSALIEDLLRNHEVIESDRNRWMRTSRAIIAIHDDKKDAITTIVGHRGSLNAAAIASRVLMEAAICECPVAGGSRPGKLDLTRMMALVMVAHYWGGYSDAIHWGAAEAFLRITPLGDVHFDHSFMDNVYEPFGLVGAEREVRDAASDYLTRFEPVDESAPDIESKLETQFTAAWESEFAISISSLLIFLEALDHTCLEEDVGSVTSMRR